MTENLTDNTIKASAKTGDVTLTASADTFNAGHVGAFFWIGDATTVDGVKKQGFVKITTVTNAKTASAKVQWELSTTEATKVWGEGAWSKYRGFPSIIGLLDGRLYYARTPTQPRNVYASKPYKYEDFTPAVSNESGAAVDIELATNIDGDGSDIKWIVGTSFLLSGTYGSEFVVKGSGDAELTDSNRARRRARVQTGDLKTYNRPQSAVRFILFNAPERRSDALNMTITWTVTKRLTCLFIPNTFWKVRSKMFVIKRTLIVLCGACAKTENLRH